MMPTYRRSSVVYTSLLLGQGTPVKVHGLVAQPWTMADRSGVSFRAARVEPAVAAAKAS